jgi:RHS repeat-associated protein
MMKNKLLMLLTLAAIMCGVNVKAATTNEMPGVDVQPASYFYTGKPYDEDLDAYTFAFRNYDPEINRWTSADPSGFPDGANNTIYVNNKSTVAIDAWSLAITLYKKPVLGGLGQNWQHSYIYFSVTDCDGNEVTGTVSGQPAGSWPNYGNLVSDPDSDLGSARHSPIVLDWVKAGWKDEYCFYLDLIGAQNAYGNDLAYHHDPAATQATDYNSNGYIHGILNELGISEGYSEASAKGWSVPIPLQYTAKFKNNTDCCE